MRSRLPEGMARPGSMADIVKKAHKIQEEIEKTKKEVANMEFSEQAGGSMVEVVTNGSREVVRVLIKPEAAQGDLEMLQDLLLVAINGSLKKATDYYDAQIDKVTGGINIPGVD